MQKPSESELVALISESDDQYGFSDPDSYVFKSKEGLDRSVVEQISQSKGEPQWMLDFRLRALEHYENGPCPTGDRILLDLIWTKFFIM